MRPKNPIEYLQVFGVGAQVFGVGAHVCCATVDERNQEITGDVYNSVNNGIFTISAGDRRISEPSTV